LEQRMDRRQLEIFPLSERVSYADIRKIAVFPDSEIPEISERETKQIDAAAEKIVRARAAGKPVILAYGAHLIKNGLGPVIAALLDAGWITHVATNGAGSIHDWEFAYQAVSSEDVRVNVAKGQFGTWDETGRNIGLSIAINGLDGYGYGLSIGKAIAEDGLMIPSRTELKDRINTLLSQNLPGETLGALADALHLVTEFDLPSGRMEVSYPFKEYSVQYAAYKKGVPFTVHPGIGYDIIYTHPMGMGGPIGRGAVRDFLSYAQSVSELGGGGVHLSVGSAIMAPMIFEKSLSMANNLAIKNTGKPLEDYYLAVVDIQDGGNWDWSHGEPPKDNPAYYLRFCKSFNRMGGLLDYVCLDNRQFMVGLCRTLMGK